MTEITAEHAHWLAVARVSQRWPKMSTGVSLSLDAVLLKPAPLRLVELTLFLDSTKSMGSSNSILNRLLLSSYTSMQNHAS